MGWAFRKSMKVAPGVRINLSRRGVGYSIGPRGLKLSRGADGKYRRTVSIPGTGLYNTTVVSDSEKGSLMSAHVPDAADEQPPGASVDAGGPLRWMRRHPKTSVAGALLALIVIGSAGDGDGSEPPDRRLAVAASGQSDLAQKLAQEEAARKAAEQAAAKAEADRATAEQRAAAEAAARAEAERLVAEQAAAANAAAERVAAEQAAAAKAEAERLAAEQAAKADADRRAGENAATAQAAAPPAAHGGATDPRYRTCKEAKSNGLGPYREGRDPEYNWYRDADNDGVVCE